MARIKVPRRFYVLAIAFLGLTIAFGFRSCFAMVMTHILRKNSMRNATELRKDCSTSNDLPTIDARITEQMIFYSHSMFYIGSIVSQIPSALLSVRFAPRKVAAVIMLLAGIGTLLLPLVIRGHVAGLMVTRFIQGGIESSFALPVYGLLAAWIPHSEKTRAMVIVSVGGYISPALALVIAGEIVCYWSWDSIFYIYAAMAFSWSLISLLTIYDLPTDDPKMSVSERQLFFRESAKVKSSSKQMVVKIPWKQILTSLPVYTLVVAEFTKEWTFTMMGVQIQQYYEDVFGVNSATSGTLAGIPDFLTIFTALLASILLDYLFNHGMMTRTTGRKLAQSIGFGFESCCILALYFVKDTQVMLAFGLLCLGVGISGVAVCGYEVNFIELAPQFTSAVSAIARLAIAGSVICTLISGEIIGNDDKAAAWKKYFLITGFLHLGGTIFYSIFASADIQPWAQVDGSEKLLHNEETSHPEEERTCYDSITQK